LAVVDICDEGNPSQNAQMMSDDSWHLACTTRENCILPVSEAAQPLTPA